MNVPVLVTKAASVLVQNKTTILTMGAVAGVVMTAVVTARNAPKAKEVLDEKRRDLEETPREDTDTRRIIFSEGAKKLTPLVLPVVFTTGFTIACIIGLNKVHASRYAAATAACTFAQQQLNEWKEKTKEVVGPKKTEEIKTAIYDDYAKIEPSTVVHTSCGDYPMLDVNSGTLFYSDNTKVESAKNKLQSELNNGMDWVSVNDFYRELGIRQIKFGEDNGWNIGDRIDIEYGYGGDNNGHPVMTIVYSAHPRRNLWGDLM